MTKYSVERQCWQHWPKVLVMRREEGLVSGERKVECRRYVPERTCRILDACGWWERIPSEPMRDAKDRDEWYGVMGCCSECGEYVPSMNYCPNCGARVIGA